MSIYENTTIVEEIPAAWFDTLGAGFDAYTRLVEERRESILRSLWMLRPGASADAFQRLAGQVEALEWVLGMPGMHRKNSQKQARSSG